MTLYYHKRTEAMYRRLLLESKKKAGVATENELLYLEFGLRDGEALIDLFSLVPEWQSDKFPRPDMTKGGKPKVMKGGGGGIETGGKVKLRCKSSQKPNGMTWPRIENETHIMTTAQGKPAEDAFRLGLQEMIIWMENSYSIEKKEAFMLLSQILEARVTQFVNPTYTYLLKVNKKYLK